MPIRIDGGAGVTFPDSVQQTNAVTNTGGSPPYYAARAWGNFKGTTPTSIRASANIASFVRTGTGDYTITFTTPMPDANYVVVGMSSGAGGIVNIDGTPTTTSFNIAVDDGSPSGLDVGELYIVVFR